MCGVSGREQGVWSEGRGAGGGVRGGEQGVWSEGQGAGCVE